MAKLLLIDDDREVLEINQKYLSSAGYNVYSSPSPREGITLAKKMAPDCIILDVMMPELDGYEVCRQIRSFSSVPIILDRKSVV